MEIHIKARGMIRILIGVMASCMSWVVNHSVLWAIFHFIVSPIYIPYWLLVYTGGVDWLLNILQGLIK